MSRNKRTSADIRYENHVKNVKSQVDKVKEAMVITIEKASERGGKLEELTERTEALESTGLVFRKDTTQLRRQNWWRNRKMTMILVCVLVVLLLVIILPLIRWK